MQTSRLLSSSANSPSFSSFSSAVDLAAIAARVVKEFRDHEAQSDSNRRDDNDDDGFEFAFDCPSRRSSHPIATADEIFCNGQIRPLNPYGGESQPTPSPSQSNLPKSRRPALGKLMSEDRDPSSESSSEADEDLAGLPPESYCVWTPKSVRVSGDDDLQGLCSSPSRSKIKSNSAGFSKRWKLRNLLYARSNSEGNEKLVFPAPIKKSDGTVTDQKDEDGEEEKESEGTKRQTFVPFRKDIVGILRNVNGLNRHLRPF